MPLGPRRAVSPPGQRELKAPWVDTLNMPDLPSIMVYRALHCWTSALTSWPSRPPAWDNTKVQHEKCGTDSTHVTSHDRELNTLHIRDPVCI